ncbi:MAG TPA: trehalase-like domain-containing protein, partial [Mycobacteriales bacterium]|nr:trehalase-like domain-containing protein [Mycobacteriales bacterium]
MVPVEEALVTASTPIADHGLIGDLQTSALVTTDGVIDWFCAPRFDSPSLFASLLDDRQGGYFRIAPDGVDYITKQLYLPGTAILITRFISADGVGELTDFMPVTGHEVTDSHRIVRMLRVVRGSMRFVADCQPRFDYARQPHKVEVSEAGVLFTGDDGLSVALHVSRRPGVDEAKRAQTVHHEEGVRAEVTLNAGEVGGIVLETAPSGPPREISAAEVGELFEQTRDYWRSWLSKSHYTGRWRETVERSAMTLKLMTYQPTGALVAAPTTALPEQPGGERNWDYRYTWIRDASFSVGALLG